MPGARPTDVGSYGEAMYERLGPLAAQDEANGWAFLVLCGAIGRMHQPVHDFVFADDDPGTAPFSPAGDVDRIPAAGLRWLAQFVGERVPPGEPEDTARDRIRTPQGKRRGSIAPILAAARKRLTGAKSVYIFERVSSEWTMTVVTRPSETPDAAGTNADLQAAKPAGVILTHTVTDLTLVEGLAGTVNALVGDVDDL